LLRWILIRIDKLLHGPTARINIQPHRQLVVISGGFETATATVRLCMDVVAEHFDFLKGKEREK
jgi:hypothetical protein